MRSYNRLFLLTLSSVFVLHSIGFSQRVTTNDNYKSRTFVEIIELNREGTDPILGKTKLIERQGFIGIDPLHSKVRVQYIGSHRPISKEHLGLIKNWEKLLKVDKKFIALYENEYLFKEGDAEYWIPVQKTLVQGLNENVKANDIINLFVVYVGAYKAVNVKDFSSIFLVTAFQQ